MPSAVSSRYAHALVDIVTRPAATEAGKDPKAVAAQLAEFRALLAENSELRILFSTPAVTAAKKKAVLGELALLLELDAAVRNFLKVLIDNDRMILLGEITEAFDSLLDERLGVVLAEITTARALDETEQKQLADALHAKTGKQVRMNFSLDRELIGGIAARIGSTIYDGSVRGQLERIRGKLTAA